MAGGDRGLQAIRTLDDLVKVADIARSMVLRYGMDPRIGVMVYEETPTVSQDPFLARREIHSYSEHTAHEIDNAVHALVREALERTKQILLSRRVELDSGAGLLLEHETLSEADLSALISKMQAI